jgi:hypothetical protein
VGLGAGGAGVGLGVGLDVGVLPQFASQTVFEMPPVLMAHWLFSHLYVFAVGGVGRTLVQLQYVGGQLRSRALQFSLHQASSQSGLIE